MSYRILGRESDQEKRNAKITYHTTFSNAVGGSQGKIPIDKKPTGTERKVTTDQRRNALLCSIMQALPFQSANENIDA
ncbi:hypothetical protein NPX13_g2969 [Xylaria arbuscula]|uniref:Uncharacterized protein n=1 Tax=Xylaria arbuscula TaxID=114810 RepID=A0A9W8NIM4_9PEZI|nr:hypothetical protein NPX13_g2969 [Xylaria arbuscula]